MLCVLLSFVFVLFLFFAFLYAIVIRRDRWHPYIYIANQTRIDAHKPYLLWSRRSARSPCHKLRVNNCCYMISIVQATLLIDRCGRHSLWRSSSQARASNALSMHASHIIDRLCFFVVAHSINESDDRLQILQWSIFQRM